MATSYSTLLGLALPVQGELSGTWGDTVNNFITTYLDAAVAGAQTLSTDANVTLSKTTNTALNGTSSQYAIINCTGARTVLRTITAPAASKIYVILNQTTGGFGVKLVGAGPTTGITVAAGTRVLAVWNGTDFVVVGATAGANTDITSLTGLSGNVSFTGTGNRITGDFSNATVANRVMFQTSTSGGSTVVGAIPNGAANTAAFNAYSNSDPTNTSFAQMSLPGADARFSSGIHGTGTYFPMTFYTSSSERMRIDTAGNVGIGTNSPVSKLHVSGTGLVVARVQSTDANYAAVQLIAATTPTANNWSLVAGFDGLNALSFRDNTVGERMRIDASGNVGIGGNNTGGYGKLQTYGTGYIANAMVSADGAAVVLAANANSDVRLNVVSNHPLSILTNNAERMRIDTSGNVLVTSPAGLGYGAGAGGTVTQATDKSTAVTLNKPCGRITMNNAALGAGANIAFQLNNSLLSGTDSVVTTGYWGAVYPAGYRVEVVTVAGGFVQFRITNITAGSLSEALEFNFAIIKGATS